MASISRMKLFERPVVDEYFVGELFDLGKVLRVCISSGFAVFKRRRSLRM